MVSDVCLTFDLDAVSVWLWGHDDWDAPTSHSRGVFGAEVATPRLLELLDEHDLPSTWFVPGHTVESFPDACEAVVEAGHDVQCHGWSHRAPASFETRADERADLERAIDCLREVTGERPTGYRSPAWDFSEHTLDLLEELGFAWDSSKMASDFRPHWVHGDWSAPRDGPYDRGEPSSVVELPVSWQRDDFPAMTYTWGGAQGYEDEAAIFRRWRDQFDWMHDSVDDGVVVFTFHPQTVGKAHRLTRLEALVEHMAARDGVRFRTMDAVAEEFRASA